MSQCDTPNNYLGFDYEKFCKLKIDSKSIKYCGKCIHCKIVNTGLGERVEKLERIENKKVFVFPSPLLSGRQWWQALRPASS